MLEKQKCCSQKAPSRRRKGIHSTLIPNPLDFTTNLNLQPPACSPSLISTLYPHFRILDQTNSEETVEVRAADGTTKRVMELLLYILVVLFAEMSISNHTRACGSAKKAKMVSGLNTSSHTRPGQGIRSGSKHGGARKI